MSGYTIVKRDFAILGIIIIIIMFALYFYYGQPGVSSEALPAGAAPAAGVPLETASKSGAGIADAGTAPQYNKEVSGPELMFAPLCVTFPGAAGEISCEDALETAYKKYPGDIQRISYGDSWNITIRSGNTAVDVVIDKKTGKIL